MSTTEMPARPSASRSALPRDILRGRPRIPGVGFGFASVHEGPWPAVHDAETGLADRMPPARAAEFRTGRRAVRRALLEAGLTPGPVLRDGRRPLPPPGTAVSVSHSGGVAVALAGSAAGFPALGVDLELGTLPAGAAHLVLHPAEQRPPTGAGDQWLTTVFSAKEAAYKAFSALLDDTARRRGALPGLRAIRMLRTPAGFTARVDAVPGAAVEVTVHRFPGGVLTWALPEPGGTPPD
ncbi:4'-phosphopantetheinyl transferase [Streptomyces sp. NPDC021020]|uniref:4'-phosphopantetheinyl transferase n=1 Tax=Streptomyces sp. NPDC021020 TaxID=3365109 RepID=UPI0037991CFC